MKNDAPGLLRGCGAGGGSRRNDGRISSEISFADGRSFGQLQDRPYSGHLARIDPGVQNGAVDVDVKVGGAQPSGVRTDLTVDGTIEVERVADAVYLGKALLAKANTRVPLFKLVEHGNEAQRVMVELGNASIDSVEIVAGLQPGDRVIVSDMSTWSKYDRVLLK